MASKDYLAEMINLTGDGYLNPTPAIYDNGLHSRDVSTITSISVHHDATPRPHDYDSVARYKQEAASHYLRLGPGLQYHYKIDNVGQIFKIRPHDEWLYVVGSNENISCLAICLDGYFHAPYNEQPTREQYEALGQLLIDLCERHPEFPATYPNVRPHRDYSSTACPGDLLAPWVYAIQNKTDIQNVPSNAVYDWPSLQPGGSTPTPVPSPIPVPTPPDVKYVRDTKFLQANYYSQVNTHLDGLDDGKLFASYPPNEKFSMVSRYVMTDGTAYLLTQYALDVFAQGKRELAGIPEKDLLPAQRSPIPIPPQDPGTVPTPPVPYIPPSPADQDHLNDRLSAIERVVKAITDFLNKIFKNWNT